MYRPCHHMPQCRSAAGAPVEVAAGDGHAALLHRLEPLLGVLVPKVVGAWRQASGAKRVRGRGSWPFPSQVQRTAGKFGAVPGPVHGVAATASAGRPGTAAASQPPARTVGAGSDKGAKLRVEAHGVDGVHIVAVPAASRAEASVGGQRLAASSPQLGGRGWGHFQAPPRCHAAAGSVRAARRPPRSCTPAGPGRAPMPWLQRWPWPPHTPVALEREVLALQVVLHVVHRHAPLDAANQVPRLRRGGRGRMGAGGVGGAAKWRQAGAACSRAHATPERHCVLQVCQAGCRWQAGETAAKAGAAGQQGSRQALRRPPCPGRRRCSASGT